MIWTFGKAEKKDSNRINELFIEITGLERI